MEIYFSIACGVSAWYKCLLWKRYSPHRNKANFPIDGNSLTKQPHNILILNGPNLNMLGVREPDVYGFKNLSQIALECEEYASELGCTIDFRQTNIEGEMVTIIQEAVANSGGSATVAGVIVNGGAYAHTSIALADALRILEVPIIEVHITNTYRREPYRHHSYIAETAQGVICGFGGHGYLLALDAMRALLEE